MANVIKHKRGSGSDPGASDLILGELAIRTDTGKLFTKMDSGAIAEIAGGGSDIAINTLSSSSGTGGGSATFNGSAYRFTLSQPPNVSAAQLLVSINGVIQKPVAGTGQPSEGFSVDGTDIILGDAPATGSDFFILTFKSLGVSEPADNSVTSAKIADGAVTNAKIASGIDGDKISNLTIDSTELADNCITSAKIVNGAIVNADINASAAIAGTKIDPNFGTQTVTSSYLTLSAVNPNISFTDTNDNPDFKLEANSGQFKIIDTSGSGSDRLIVQNDGTIDVEGNLDANGGLDVTGAITGTGAITLGNGSGVNWGDTSARIIGESGGSGLLRFDTNGGEKMRIDSSGRLLLGTTTGASTDSGQGGTLTIANTNAGITLRSGTSNVGSIYFSDGTSGNDELRGLIQYNHSSNFLRFWTDASERMRIDSSGAVRIGHTDAIGNASADNLVIGTGSGNNGLSIYSGNDSQGRIDFRDTTGTSDGQGIIFYQHTTDSLQIHTNSAERMRIDSSGHFLFNCTSLPSSSNAGAAIEKNGGTGTFRFSSGSTTASSNAFEFINANGVIGTINLNGSTTTFNDLSDYRVKENAVAISDGIQRLKTLKPYRFNYITDPTKTVDGFFAHEVTAVPEAISGTKDEVVTQAMIDAGDYKEGTLNDPIYQGIDQSKLVPLLVAALQEAIGRIEVLEAK